MTATKTFLFLAAILLATGAAPPAEAKGPARARWIRIEYDDLIDRSLVTHSGKTVGALLRTLPRKGGRFPPPVLADLQPHLEPFSFVLREIVPGGAPTGGKGAYRNVVEEYPSGSRQPAWAALFREGRYQLAAGDGRARLFIEGEDPSALFRRHHGVVRHPLARVLEEAGGDRIVLEVYAFRNDYAARTLFFNPDPYVTEILRADLAPKAREISLPELAEFFSRAPTLEAAEIDDNEDLFLYGNYGKAQTIAGRPISLSDFAVVYRAVFHHGYAPPFVSLDPSGDNRYAKVNFGGLLTDTRVGTVLMEADRLFKTMITGLDPGSCSPVADNVRGAVPDFRTMDERALFRDKAEDTKVRFWFYPDQIRTVTDGRIGVVETYRFTAAEERLGGKVRSDPAGREMIDHLNGNFDRYVQAFPVYGELLSVGRMMAVAKWLHEAGARRRVDLDALLSVELPPHATPRRNRKLLAATDGVRFRYGNVVKEFRKVYCFDGFLEEGGPDADDEALVDRARRHVKGMGIETLIPGGMFRYFSENQRYTVTSISGGIDMNPEGLAPPRRLPDSPLLRKVRDARPVAPENSTPGEGMIRSTVRGRAAPARGAGVRRKKEPTESGSTKPRPAIASPGIHVNGGEEAFPASLLRAGGKPNVVTDPSYPSEILLTADPSKGGTIVLKKGKPIGAEPAPVPIR